MASAVRLYGLLSCPHCKAARNFLQESTVEFETVFVDLLLGDEKSEAMRELRQLNPEITFPTLVIGGRVIVGYKKDEISEALSAISNEQ